MNAACALTSPLFRSLIYCHTDISNFTQTSQIFAESFCAFRVFCVRPELIRAISNAIDAIQYVVCLEGIRVIVESDNYFNSLILDNPNNFARYENQLEHYHQDPQVSCHRHHLYCRQPRRPELRSPSVLNVNHHTQTSQILAESFLCFLRFLREV